VPKKLIRKFLQLEAIGGIILFCAALLAICFDNSRLASVYENLLAFPVSIGFGSWSLSKHLLEWINDGLMVVFFLIVGLEIKKEMISGELNSKAKVFLPLAAALGGMLCPALVFWAFNNGNALAMRGWAIPTATDIAFSLGILSLLGSRVPISLKIFLTALAIFDDLGAIIIIATFYTTKLSFIALALAGFLIFILFLLNYLNIRALTPYMLTGFLLWLCVLNSGVHATLAGVALAFAIPLKSTEYLIKILHPWVVFFILPVFAFFNAGVSFQDVPPGIHNIFSPVMLGIACGLFLGKLAGVFGTTFLTVKLKLAPMPAHSSWPQIFGIALVCGVGFTMSFFVGTLAYPDGISSEPLQAWVRLGVIFGSLASGLLGYIVLRLSTKIINSR
jgi:NhaA family Na+:H+ antiporter